MNKPKQPAKSKGANKMSEWDLMKQIAEASNNGNQRKLSRIIMAYDFSAMPQAITMLFNCFELTEENIKTNLGAAKKLVELPEPEAFRELLRQEMLRELLAKKNQHNRG